MPNEEDLELPRHSFAFSVFQQQPYSNIDNRPHSFASTSKEFVNNLFGANVEMPEAAHAYMQSMYSAKYSS